jgi:glycosyltransferase involved in cell wall biosynthesis
MKIAIFLPSLRGGGAESNMVSLARGFVQQGLAVDLVLAKAEGPYLSQLPPEVQMVDLGASRVLASLPGLVCYLRRERPRAMLSAMDHANVVAVWARRLARVPVRLVASVRSTPSLDSSNAKNLQDRLMPLFIRFAYRDVDAVVPVSQGAADDLHLLTGLPRHVIRVIYNPVVRPELFQKAQEPLGHSWFQPGKPPVVLGVGRLTVQKDFPTLIRAFALVRRQRQARLMILGEGGERAQIEALTQKMGLGDDEVSLPGFVENPYPYMKNAGVFVLSSRWEGLPTVLIEAAALGVPLVATDCPSGPAEILENGKWGRMVTMGDFKQMAQAILQVLSNGNPIIPAVLLKERFSLDASIAAYISLLVGSQ